MRRPKLIGCAGITPCRDSLRMCFREQSRYSAATLASTKYSSRATVLLTETDGIEKSRTSGVFDPASRNRAASAEALGGAGLFNGDRSLSPSNVSLFRFDAEK